ncbi:uncharacterized protein LOC143026057 [Oratosquilla oratoria]|uniref:uncharacterized protein LOC143026057 n=1 Tax=Oratosquilla oratoria TaxID=337810 RepID=UPI003F75D2C8
MLFNNKKFELIRYGPNENLKEHRNTVGAEEIKTKETMRDLGLWVSDDCGFNAHITQNTSAACKMRWWILRTFKTRKPEHLLPLWKTLVVAKLEYVCQLWFSHKVEEIQELEQVKRVFRRKLVRDSLNYWERLKILKLYSLERRRERYIMIYVWKVLEGTAPNPSQNEGGGI